MCRWTGLKSRTMYWLVLFAFLMMLLINTCLLAHCLWTLCLLTLCLLEMLPFSTTSGPESRADDRSIQVLLYVDTHTASWGCELKVNFQKSSPEPNSKPLKPNSELPEPPQKTEHRTVLGPILVAPGFAQKIHLGLIFTMGVTTPFMNEWGHFTK